MSAVTTSDGQRLLQGIPWGKCTPSKVSIDLTQLLVAASLIESRGDSYGEYLARVFCDEPYFVSRILKWSKEENEHGIALSTWLKHALPELDFDALFKRYTTEVTLAYQDSDEQRSIRGSKSAELLSRCSVESGTSTYYKAMSTIVEDEPLRIICLRLAADEISHYGLFKSKLDEMRSRDGIHPFRLLYNSLFRLFELEDDQVSYAYYLARSPRGSYDKEYYSNLMTRTLFSVYNRDRVSELVKLNLRAFGLSKAPAIQLFSYGKVVQALTTLLFWYIRLRVFRMNWKINFRRIRYQFFSKNPVLVAEASDG